MEIRLLGPLTVLRDGAVVPLPASRKVRALVGYLALAPQPVSRDRLCELFWDVPNDPRGELRWCLSKIRAIVDEPSVARLHARGVTVVLDGCAVDAADVTRAVQQIDAVDVDRLRALAASFRGDVLDGLDAGASAELEQWLGAQRRRMRSCRTAILERLVALVPRAERIAYIEAWLELAPFDARAHAAMFDAMAGDARYAEGDAHLAAVAKRFESEGLDTAVLRDAWTGARVRARDATPHDDGLPRRASVAVMPFDDVASFVPARGGTADGFANDVTTRLAKLRSMFVIAHGTMSVLRERDVAPGEAARMLDVDYVVTGAIRKRGERIEVRADLTETRTARIVWSDTFERRAGDALDVLDAIGDRIVASVASEIEANERNRAVLRPPASLNAWEAYHRGLWHMYRFARADNDQAQAFFEAAVRADPTFARAYAGLSFTHWQRAFQGWSDPSAEMARALVTAEQSVLADERDPAAHWAMGRALWLHDRYAECESALQQAVELSPNFALGHYTLSFVRSQAGDPRTAIDDSDRARDLSPFDPLLFGMLATRAIALSRLGSYDRAAEWGVRAANRPNAHAHIQAIAALSLALAGRLDDARARVAAARRAKPGYTFADFLRAFRVDADTERLFQSAAKRVGMA